MVRTAVARPGAPPRPEARGAVVAPLVTGGAALAGTLLLAAVDPTTTHVPLCPLKAVTGLDCPFCGSLRAVHALTRADLATAADHNLVFTVAVPFLVAAWLWWTAEALGRRVPVPAMAAWAPARARTARWLGVGVLVAFAVVRNLPSMHWLASTA